ncbi:MAG: hypothetical protein RI977_975, partial [Bacteroidota bacterium]
SQQQIIHQFTYHKYMHQPGYENGGYSLEHADSATPCKDLFLWHSNTHLGGTPSQPNHPPKPFPSIKHPNGNTPQPFQIAYIAAIHPDTLLLEFTDPISTSTHTLSLATHPVNPHTVYSNSPRCSHLYTHRPKSPEIPHSTALEHWRNPTNHREICQKLPWIAPPR